MFSLCIMLVYCIKISRSKKQMYSFPAHLTDFFVPLQGNIKNEW